MVKQTVLLIGATGRTGQSIANGLLNHGNFDVKAAVRPASAGKPTVKQLSANGIDVRVLDIERDSTEKLEDALRDVDILISTVQITVDQKPIFQAAKNAGVRRVIPSDFGPPEERGLRMMHDQKLDIRDYIKDIGVGFTFIEVGWWFEAAAPLPHNYPKTPFTAMLTTFFGDGNVKFAYTALDNLGDIVARILDDERTLNQTVMTHDGETTQSEVWKIAEKIIGEDFTDYPRLSREEVESKCDPSTADLTTFWGLAEVWIQQYIRSVFFHGQNTVLNAIKLGALDARKLYPDYQPESFEERAKKHYENLPAMTESVYMADQLP